MSATIGHCNLRINDERCNDIPAYWVWFRECDVCVVRHGWLGCWGHRCCVKHTAELRREIYKFDGPDLPGSDTSPQRLSTLVLR